jgi:EmrB/QacA subfamily drug resistance transporter
MTPPDPRRWVALAFIAIAQLMIALDATIVSIALPSAQVALGASDANRQWVVTAYTLAFGGLLLLGGRIADYIGRKRAFLVGLAGFGLASMIGGAAPDFAVLIGARALQGAFAALLAPTALSLLAVSFTEPRERATAFAVYGSIAGSGAAIGFLMGGVLTQYLAWRWCLYVNIPIAILAAAGATAVLPRSSRRAQPKFDLLGVVLATGGMVTLVYALSDAIGLLALSAVLLVLFVAREARTLNPVLPLRIVLDRSRGGSYATVALVIAGMFGAFLFLTYYFQVVLHYTPFQAGLAFLPMVVAQQAGSWLIASRLMPLVPPRVLMAPGAIVAAVGMMLLVQVPLLAEVLLGLGVSCVMVPAFSTATQRVHPREAGVASATVNAATQIGGSVGAALLNSIAVGEGGAIVHGFAVAAAWGVGLFVLAALTSGLLINFPSPLAGEGDPAFPSPLAGEGDPAAKRPGRMGASIR